MKVRSKIREIGNGIGVYTPKQIRDQLDLSPGDEVLLDINEDGNLVVEKV